MQSYNCTSQWYYIRTLCILGDGNCFYHATSLGAFGNVKFHSLLQLFVAIEVLQHQEYYDCGYGDDYVDIFQDNRVVLEDFPFFLENLLKLGGYACMHTISATSAVLNAPIRSYCPPNKGAFFDSDPLTRVVVGRGVRRTKEEVCFVMWSMVSVPRNADKFRPNHFALLYDKTLPSVEVISCNDADNENDDGNDEGGGVSYKDDDEEEDVFGDDKNIVENDEVGGVSDKDDDDD